MTQAEEAIAAGAAAIARSQQTIATFRALSRYEQALEAQKAEVNPDHVKWHKAFGNDCRLPDCPIKKGALGA